MLSSRPGAIYQQDNARPHTARLSQQCLQGYDVLPWPAKSPDLSPIEHHRARCTPVVIGSFEHYTIWLSSSFEGEHPGCGHGPPTNITRGLAVRRIFRVLLCRKGTIPLPTSTPSPGFEQRSYGSVVSVNNRYTGWVVTEYT
ncbi:HTH_Tnp_Tc3_2 domain-containing protein [Trichonephila clavipes]|nr:HTH_Tnp_Tc3_2 domain-containing protein [Trichonephila clavipes]